jgi:hypothetical protein
VDIGAEVKEQVDGVQVATLGCQRQCCAVIRIDGVNVSSGGSQLELQIFGDES